MRQDSRESYNILGTVSYIAKKQIIDEAKIEGRRSLVQAFDFYIQYGGCITLWTYLVRACVR